MDWLLLRGLAREQRHWGRFPDALAARLGDGSRVHSLDLPGTGTEHARRGPTDVRAIAADLRERWQPLRAALPGPVALLGISLGGMVAMQWAGEHPHDFAALVLVNTSAADLSPPWRRMSLGVLPSVAKALLGRDPVVRERRILGVTARMATDLDAVAERHASYQRDRPVSRANVLRQLLAGSRFRAPASIAVPTLIVAGARDPLADPACARALAARFGAPLEVHPEAGHDLSLDDPDWLAERIAVWSKTLRA